jgi:hypothetical protein
VVEDTPIGYGHLDKEGDKTWLGVAVISRMRGKGFGERILFYLINRAKSMCLDKIHLSVDIINEGAIALYKKYGFEKTKNTPHIQFMELDLMSRLDIEKLSVSTISNPYHNITKFLTFCKLYHLNVEFSSGLSPQKNIVDIFHNYPFGKTPHNYFPAPEEPFVLNLASKNQEIRQRSIEHCYRGVDLAVSGGSHYYSAHAGFCVDPTPLELGKPFKLNQKYDRPQNFNLFVDSVKSIVDYAKENSCRFLIENNVIIQENFVNRENPLFCCTAEEMIQLYKRIDDSDNFGILLDTAHLKVSSTTLGFELDDAVQNLTPIVKCVHHSDNNGNYDTNSTMDNDYWFKAYMKYFKTINHVLEVKRINEKVILSQLNLLAQY